MILASSSKSISFCISCRNRLWQIQDTLLKNLSCLDEDLEIVLVDYGSSDGFSDWVWANFKEFIDNKKLVFFEVKNPVVWSSPRAKNLAHRLSNGQYLFNLDADNFITPLDVNLIRKSHKIMLPSHQWSRSWADGSFGRIGIPRELFFKLGGYDETLLPMGGQDLDLLNRIVAASISIAKLPSPGQSAILNSKHDKLREVNPKAENVEAFYKMMNEMNLNKSKIRLDLEGPYRNDGFQSYKGLLNGKMIVINGFNEITSI